MHAATAPGRPRTTGAHALLQQVLTELTGQPEHVLVRCCLTCGGAHGKPVLADRDLHVSLAAAPGRAVIAITAAGPVGVDVEHHLATDFDGFAQVALGPDEVDGDAAHRARTWTRKEAVLKATGHGLAVDPRNVEVTADLVLGAHLLDVDLGAGLACAVAVLAPAAPVLRVEERRFSPEAVAGHAGPARGAAAARPPSPRGPARATGSRPS